MNTEAPTPPVTTPATAPKRRGLGTMEKAILGCALGCGGLILITILAGVGGFYWLLSPGRQIDTPRIVSPEAVGTVEFRRSLEDPGVAAVLKNFITAVQESARRQQQEEMPPSLRWIQDLQGNPTQGMQMWIPRGATIAVELTADFDPTDPENHGPSYVAAVNLRSFPRLIRTMVGMLNKGDDSGEVAKIPYRDYTIERLGQHEPVYMTFDGGSMLLSDNLEVLQRALDRLAAPEEILARPAAAAALGLPQEFNERWDATAIYANPDDLFGATLVEWIAPNVAVPGSGESLAPPSSAAIRAFAAGIDLVDGDQAEAELHLGFDADAADAMAQWQDYLRGTFDAERWRHQGSGLHPQLELTTTSGGTLANVLVARLRVTGMEIWMQRLVDDLEGTTVEVSGDTSEGVQVEVE